MNAQEIGENPSSPEQIAGRVIQQTAGGKTPNGVQIHLWVVNNAENLLEEQTQTVGSDGQFKFEDFRRGEQIGYRLIMRNNGLMHTVKVGDSTDPSNISVPIYETTNSLDQISIGTHAMIVPTVDGRSRSMAILEMVQLVNSGDRIFVPDAAPSGTSMPQLVRFALPAGYQNLTVESDLPEGGVVEIDRGFGLNNSVPPGKFALLFSYSVGYKGDSITFNRTLPLGTSDLRTLIQPSYGHIYLDGYSEAEQVKLGDTNYRVQRGTNYLPGTSVQILFTELPEPSLIDGVTGLFVGKTFTTLVIPVTVSLVMAGLLCYALIFRTQENSRSRALRELNQRSILEEIAVLDRQHEKYEIDVKEYKKLRSSLINRALDQTEIKQNADDISRN